MNDHISKLANKLASIPLEAKASIVFMLASICSQGANFITMPIFTRIMTPAQMGNITTYTTWYGLLGSVISLGLTSGSFNVAMMKYKEERDKYQSSVLGLSLLPSILFFVVCLLFREPLSVLLGISPMLVELLGAMLVLNPGLSFWLMRQRYELKYRSVFWVTVANTGGGTILSALSVWFFSLSGVTELPEVRLLTTGLVTLLVTVPILAEMVRRGGTLHDARMWTYSLKTSLPLMVHGLAKYVLDASNRIMIGLLVGQAAVGIYGVLSSVSSISLLVWNAINATLIPFMFNALGNGRGADVRDVIRKMLAIYAAACVFLMLIAPEIVSVLATEEYREAVFLMPPISAGIFFTSLYNVYSNLVLYKERTSLIMSATIVAAASNIALNAVFLPIYGYMASAYATLACNALLALGQFAASRALGMSGAVDNRFSLLLSLGMFAAVGGVNLLYRSDPIRYAVAALIFVLLLANRKRIVGLVGRIKR